MAKRKTKAKAKKATRIVTVDQEAEIVARFLAGDSDDKLATSYGVHRNTIINVRNRRGVKASHRQAGSGKGGESKPEPREDLLREYDALEDVPDDPIRAMAWGRRALMCMARQVMRDRRYDGTEAQRRKEAKELIKASAALKDEDALADALEQLRLDREGMETNGASLRDVDPSRKRRRAHIASPS